jgi:RNA polymerase sigma-70 factor (ECF subfamily)
MGVSPLADLYDQHGARLYRYALLILADAAAAEDALQEAFCRVARAMSRSPGIATVPYLTATVRNECYDALRRRRRDLESNGPLLEPHATVVCAEERLTLEAALRRLPPEQREVVYLKAFEGRTFQEIAEICRINSNTAASRYRYALDALRRAFDVDRSRT